MEQSHFCMERSHLSMERNLSLLVWSDLHVTFAWSELTWSDEVTVIHLIAAPLVTYQASDKIHISKHFSAVRNINERIKCQSIYCPQRVVKILAFSLPIVYVYKPDVKFYGVFIHKINEVTAN